MRRNTLGDEGRDAPQRGLLVREQAELGPGLGVGDGRGHELRERGDPGLGVPR